MVAMSVVIGRTTGLRLQSVPVFSGDRLMLSGHILPTTDKVQAIIAARQQLVGYVDNPDEEAIRVTCSGDSSLDGYYKILSASAGDGSVFAGPTGRFMVEAERLKSGYRNVVNEGTGVCFTRTNSHAITGQSGQWSVPAAATAIYPPGGWNKNLARVTRTADTGALTTAFIGEAVDAASGRYVVPPASHYDGSARIESKLGGSTYYEMVGRQAPLTATNWRLSNGILRIQNSATTGLVDMYVYDGSAWSTTPIVVTMSGRSATFTDATTSAASLPVVQSVTVMRNSPELCVVRLAVRYTSSSVGGSVGNPLATANNIESNIMTIDISLRRGDHLATVAIYKHSSTYILLGHSAAATAITGGLRETANNADGDRFVILSPRTPASSPGTCVMYVGGPGSPQVQQFGIGVEINGSSATGQQVAQQIAYQWFTPFVETSREVLQ